MDYTEEELLDFIERHDEHEGYYREQLDRLRKGAIAADSGEAER